jgi:hypothetical protein
VDTAFDCTVQIVCTDRTERETDEPVAAVEGALQLLGVTDATVLVKEGLSTQSQALAARQLDGVRLVLTASSCLAVPVSCADPVHNPQPWLQM